VWGTRTREKTKTRFGSRPYDFAQVKDAVPVRD
jgi:hypothetical protein